MGYQVRGSCRRALEFESSNGPLFLGFEAYRQKSESVMGVGSFVGNLEFLEFYKLWLLGLGREIFWVAQ